MIVSAGGGGQGEGEGVEGRFAGRSTKGVDQGSFSFLSLLFFPFFLSGQGEYLQDVWSQHLREHILCLPKSCQTKRAQGEKEESVHEERGETKAEKVKVFM